MGKRTIAIALVLDILLCGCRSAPYNYGIEGVSYTLDDGASVLNKELVANGFSNYRAVGINYEPFGGYWL